MLIIKDIFLLLLEEAQQRSKNARSHLQQNCFAETFLQHLHPPFGCSQFKLAVTEAWTIFSPDAATQKFYAFLKSFVLWCTEQHSWNTVFRFGHFCQWYVVCFVLLKQVWWRLSPQTVWICYCLPIWNVTSVINPLWWFSFFLALAIHFCEGQYQVTSPLCLQQL